jgi:O-antigen ligase
MAGTGQHSGGQLSSWWKGLEQAQQFFAVYALLLLGSLFASIALDFYFLAALPAVLLVAFLAIVDLKAIFLLLLFSIPLSTELFLPNGFALEVPTEPFMVGLMLAGLLLLLRHAQSFGGQFVRHPLTLLLLLHLGWIGVSALLSNQWTVSIKFLLAKLWYVSTFFFLASRMLDGERDIKRFFWAVFLPLLFTILVITVRHAAYGFTFSDVRWVLSPFYRNHVSYAAIVVLFVPFLWFVRLWYPKGSWKRRLIFWSLPIFLVAIQLSYTRAAYVAVFAAIGAYFIIQWRLTRWVVVAAMIAAVLGLGYMVSNNRYLDYAPDYATTISHEDFNNLLEATYQLEDISTMERLYRWVAGVNMTASEPLFGFGPGNFYFFYKSYTVTSFTTYVSDNPERSGIHNYYLMILVEQGIPGLLIFLLMLFTALTYGERIYHRAKDPRHRQIAMMAMLCIIIISVMQLINDLLETDKVGPFFFMSFAMLVNIDLRERRLQREAKADVDTPQS